MNFPPYSESIKARACVDCGKYPFNRFMVRNEVWYEAFPTYKQVWIHRRAEGLFTNLCIPCVEELLGRRLTLDDLTMAPINKYLFQGYEMEDGTIKYAFEFAGTVMIFSKQKCFCAACGKELEEILANYFHMPVCSVDCREEIRWRETLSVMGKEYYPRKKDEAASVEPR